MKLKIIATAIVSALLMTGCASSLDQNVYSRSEARSVQNVVYGRIVSLRPVQIEGTKTPIGALAGAGLGGIAGSTMGGGRGSIVTTVIGAVGGGLLGAYGEEKLTQSSGVEITFQMENGATRSVVQEVTQNEIFRVGDRVRVMSSGQNTRVTRDF